MRRVLWTLLGVAVLTAAFAAPAASQDVLTVATVSGTAGTTVQVPIYVADFAGTPLGIDAAPGSRIQALAVTVVFSPTSAVSAITIVRSGITAALTPLIESVSSTSSTISYVGSFSETTNFLAFTQPPLALGNQVLRLNVTLAPTATGTITLTPFAGTTTLSNQAGTVSETAGNGGLTLVAGAIALGGPTTTGIPTLGEWGCVIFAVLIVAIGADLLRRRVRVTAP